MAFSSAGLLLLLFVHNTVAFIAALVFVFIGFSLAVRYLRQIIRRPIVPSSTKR